MSKTVSTETSSDEFLSLHNLVETFSNGLVSLTGTYDSALSQMNLSSVDFSGWNDAVKVNLESSYEELRNASNTISFDISGGSFSRLKECARNLSNLLNDCYEKKVEIEEKKDELDRTPEYIDKDITPDGDILDPATGEMKPRIRETIRQKNSKYTSLKTAIENLNTELQNKADECNTLFAEISSIEFNNSTTSVESNTTNSNTASDAIDVGNDNSDSFESNSPYMVNGIPDGKGNTSAIVVDPNSNSWIIYKEGTGEGILYVNKGDGEVACICIDNCSSDAANAIFDCMNQYYANNDDCDGYEFYAILNDAIRDNDYSEMSNDYGINTSSLEQCNVSVTYNDPSAGTFEYSEVNGVNLPNVTANPLSPVNPTGDDLSLNTNYAVNQYRNS